MAKLTDWTYTIPPNKKKNQAGQEVKFRIVTRDSGEKLYLVFIFNLPNIFLVYRKQFLNEEEFRADLRKFDKYAIRYQGIKTYKEGSWACATK